MAAHTQGSPAKGSISHRLVGGVGKVARKRGNPNPTTDHEIEPLAARKHPGAGLPAFRNRSTTPLRWIALAAMLRRGRWLE